MPLSLRAPSVLAASVLVPSLLALPLLLASPSTAEACGGTFCDNSGPPMPVDQTGEDILFIQDGSQIEVHVRIQYMGEAENFAWLVPLQALPEVDVGSDALFAQLATATAPQWGRTLEFQCEDEDWTEPPDITTGGSFVPDSDIAGAGGPDIVLEETVGAFEVVVLEGGTAATVMSWLGDNGYEQDAEAGPILQEYLDEGFLFAAVKLTAGAAVEEIHPLSFRMDGDEPCVPLRLTRIAAQDDMGVRAYFLGQSRWAPLNYKHVELNTLAFPWHASANIQNSRAAYTDLLGAAVDIAGGRAFTTDYAGDTAVVSIDGVYDPVWDETIFVGATPTQAIEFIAAQGLNTHALIQALLMQYIPPPGDVPPTLFWNNLDRFEDQIDLDAWDSVAFADDLAARIIDPGLHAADLLGAWPYLTRMVTLISPHEMTEDPIFIETPDLEMVSNVKVAEGLDRCGENGSRYKVPWNDNPVPVCLPEVFEGWPEILQQHPARRVEQITPMGPPQVVEDFSAMVVEDWTAYQIEQGCADPEAEEGGEEGASADAGADGEGGGKGCSCSAGEDGPAGALGFGLALLGLASIAGARRRERV